MRGIRHGFAACVAALVVALAWSGAAPAQTSNSDPTVTASRSPVRERAGRGSDQLQRGRAPTRTATRSRTRGTSATARRRPAEPVALLPDHRRQDGHRDRVRRQGRHRQRDDERHDPEPTATRSIQSATAASPSAGLAPLAVQFTGAATDFDGHTVSYSWDLDGDGDVRDHRAEPDAGPTPRRAPTPPMLRVTDPFGGASTRTPDDLGAHGDDRPGEEVQHPRLLARRRASGTPRSTRGSRRSSCSASRTTSASTRSRSRRCSPTRSSPATTRSSGSRPPATCSTTTSRRRSSATSTPAAATSASTPRPTPSTRGRGTASWSAATSATTPTARRPRRSKSRTRRIAPRPICRRAGRAWTSGTTTRSPINPSINGGGTDFSTRNTTGIHVLLTMDESTYNESDGYDRRRRRPSDLVVPPLSTAGAPGTPGSVTPKPSYLEPEFLQHVLGGLEIASGFVADDTCGIVERQRRRRRRRAGHAVAEPRRPRVLRGLRPGRRARPTTRARPRT